MLARDKGWRQKIEAKITSGLTAEAAVQSVREDLRARMKAVANDYIRDRLIDLDDLGHRLLSQLIDGDETDSLDDLPADAILICRSMSTAELLRLSRKHLSGLVVMDATPSSHLAIIAAARGLPALGQTPGALTQAKSGDKIILDAVNGQLVLRPDDAVRREFEAHIAARRAAKDSADAAAGLPCLSLDGVRFEVMANAGLLLDLQEIAPMGDTAIGLYRTEMAFLVRSNPPSVAEQTQLYRRVFERMAGRKVLFRTLDIGSDKQLAGLEGQRLESNPALGWRAIRMGLDAPDLLIDQCRALLEAAGGRALSIMFPMVSEVEEFDRARTLLMEVLDAHIAAGGTAPEAIKTGVMIEVPALLWDPRPAHVPDRFRLGGDQRPLPVPACGRPHQPEDRQAIRDPQTV